MGIKERQERERETVRGAILDAARDLFVKDGYQHVSIRKIAERIEYSPAAIYGYFPSKDDIFFALAEEGFELLDQVAASTPVPADPVDAVRRSMWAFYEFSKRYPEHFVLMFLDRSVPRIGAHYQEVQVLVELKRRIAAMFQRCVDEGLLPPGTNAMSAFRLLSSAMVGAAGVRLFQRLAPGEDPDALVHDVIEVVLAGLQSGVPLTFEARFSCPAFEEPSGVAGRVADVEDR